MTPTLTEPTNHDLLDTSTQLRNSYSCLMTTTPVAGGRSTRPVPRRSTSDPLAGPGHPQRRVPGDEAVAEEVRGDGVGCRTPVRARERFLGAGRGGRVGRTE